MNFCSSCGTIVHRNEQACSGCGAVIEGRFLAASAPLSVGTVRGEPPGNPTLWPRLGITVVLAAVVLGVGFLFLKLAWNSHLLSSALYYGNMAAFFWIAWKVGLATYHAFRGLLGDKFAGCFGVVVGFVVLMILMGALDKMSHDVVRHYFESSEDDPAF